MSNTVKKYLSFFILLLFLFPTIERGVHAFNHVGDTHCNSSDKHFHTEEHHCSICDFTSTDSNAPVPTNYSSIIIVSDFLFHPFSENVPFQIAFQHLPSRAPPLA